MKLLTIDGNSVLNRAFYGIKLLTTKEGVYTNGIYGFLSILLKVLEETAPDRVAVTFDKKGPTFRHKQFDGYKAGRKGMPPELAEQLPVLKQLLADLGYAVVECEGYEADDILGTLSRACQQQGGQCVIATETGTHYNWSQTRCRCVWLLPKWVGRNPRCTMWRPL